MSKAMASFRPTRAKGQCFLQDPDVIARIVEALGPRPDEILVEIGPGLGQLTLPVADRGARVVAVEHDARLAHQLSLYRPKQIEVLQADATELALDAVLDARGVETARVYGNLPYSVAAPILLRLLSDIDRIPSLLLMFQKEVAERLVARPSTKDYSFLSVVCQQAAHPELLFSVPPKAFRPRPRVVSSIVRLTPHGNATANFGDERMFRAIVKALMAHRRKTISNNVKHLDAQSPVRTTLGSALDQAEIDPSRRAETLSIEEFAALGRICASRT